MIAFRHRPTRPPGRAFADAIKRGATRALDLIGARCADRALPAADEVGRVLLIRANFRMGNAVLATSLLPVIRARFPHARIDLLATDATAPLFAGLGIDQIHEMSRKFIRAPWHFVRLFIRLRRRHYDLAIDGGMRSFSGALYAWLCGATWRLGRRGRNDRLLNVRLELPGCASVYGAPFDVALALGVEVDAWPSHHVTAVDAAAAGAEIASWTGPAGLEPAALVGVFIGGHAHKRWPREKWLRLLRRLDQDRVPTLVFFGPEESELEPLRQPAAWASTRMVAPRPLRGFAALVAQCRVLITPDSGPMHLAAALGVPVLAILPTEHSRFFVPPGDANAFCLNPEPEEVCTALQLVLRRIAPPDRPLRGQAGDVSTTGRHGRTASEIRVTFGSPSWA